MLTTCPNCNLTLVVTTADLRVAEGYVRCGRCRSVFNAMASLADAAPESPPDSTPDSTPESSPESPEQFSPPPERAADVLTESTAEFTLESLSDLQIETPAAIGPEAIPADDAMPDAEPPPARSMDTQEQSVAQAGASAQDATIEAAVVMETLEPVPASDSPMLPDEPVIAAPTTTPREPPAEFTLEPARPRHTGTWLAGALILLLVLGAQVVNHYRGFLATVPSIGPRLRTVYGVLGVPVEPRWNVHAYDARQLGATVSRTHPHRITVRASIANRGRWPLPLPLLRLTLQNRYGKTVAARDIAPRDYWPTGTPIPSHLGPGQRIDATITFVTPGPRAVSFEIDTCLREAGTVLCTHGPR